MTLGHRPARHAARCSAPPAAVLPWRRPTLVLRPGRGSGRPGRMATLGPTGPTASQPDRYGCLLCGKKTSMTKRASSAHEMSTSSVHRQHRQQHTMAEAAGRASGPPSTRSRPPADVAGVRPAPPARAVRRAPRPQRTPGVVVLAARGPSTRGVSVAWRSGQVRAEGCRGGARRQGGLARAGPELHPSHLSKQGREGAGGAGLPAYPAPPRPPRRGRECVSSGCRTCCWGRQAGARRGTHIATHRWGGSGGWPGWQRRT